MSSNSANVNVGNFVTVRPSCLEGDINGRSNFKIWEEQMLCLVESQDVAGFVDGEIEAPIKEENEQLYKERRRGDRLVKGWILGSIGKDALHAVWDQPTARSTWLELHRFFDTRDSERESENENEDGNGNEHELKNENVNELENKNEIQHCECSAKYNGLRTWKSRDGLTPQMLFSIEHAQLRAEGEAWMKNTSNSCTVAATLIATVMFASAFTVPGGLESTTGVPLFAGQTAFSIFAIADTISLFTSVSSVLAFLSIATSRYAEEDFLYLTKTLSFGMLTLFISILFMLVAFAVALYLVPYAKMTWFVGVLAAVAVLPVTQFVLVLFPLLIDVVSLTYGPGIFGKRSNRVLY